MAEIAKVWTFSSDSSDKTYETMQYEDGSTSCNCKGWTIKRHDIRSCKHTRMVDQGIADRMCISSVDYMEVKAAPVSRKAKPVAPITVNKGRKFSFE